MKIRQIIYKYQEESKSDVSIMRRFISYLFDWYVGGVFSSLPILIIYQVIVEKEIVLSQSLLILPENYRYLAGMLTLLLAFFYYVIVPFFFWKGQTLGKRLLKIKITNNDYSDVTFKTLCLRQALIMFLIEGRLIMPSIVLFEMISLLSQTNILYFSNIVCYTITISSVIIAINLNSKRSLHDLISGTRVMMLDSKIISVANKKKKKLIKKELNRKVAM